MRHTTLYFGDFTTDFFLSLKNSYSKISRQTAVIVQHIYTLFIIIIGWGLFYFTDVGQLGEFMVDLFNFGNGICGDQAFNLIMSNMPMLIIAAVASTPLATMLYTRFEHRRFMWIPETLYCMGVLAVSTASLVNQSYNPFLYFRF